ncbi:PIN domain nuclease [Brucepastera parasyntrophica]|uniref:PIN domain nuclease n=1 Tax=Brucepastera parasyntrophica TaxID=2880008 RepID=UPI00210D7FD9|nr:PIN domain nuclease [Brucepastera parasyntrophica]ULQ58996.1 PIN domain nuclease [Brucepastera parasyntrophica]
MIILDTPVWMEFFTGNPLYFSSVSGLMERKEILALECIFGELLKESSGPRERDIITGYWEHLPRADSTGLFIEAGMYLEKKPGADLINTLVLMHAKKYAVPVWTTDVNLLKLLPEELRYRDAPAKKAAR